MSLQTSKQKTPPADHKETIQSPIDYFNKKHFNLAILVSLVLTSGLFLCTIVYDAPLVYQTFVLIIPVILGAMFLLRHFGNHQMAHFIGFAVLPFWLNVATLFIGPGFSESPIMIAFFMFIFALYRNNLQARALILYFTIACHVGVLTYLNFYPPISEYVNIPLDDILVFLIAGSWIMLFLKTIENNKSEMITRLEKKNKNLTATSLELERFTHIASHDLKSPLRTIISFSDMIERNLQRGNFEGIDADLDFIKSGAKQMNYLITDILEFSRLSDANNIKRSKIDLSKVFDITISNLQAEIIDKNAKISKGDLPEFFGNTTELVLLFQNIIENGLKYNTSKNPIVYVWSDQIDDQLLINFKDNGIGIEEAYHDQIFEFFKRLHSNESYQGTGLGLGLCNKIIQKYKGNITIESEVGVGSTFSIQLPMPISPKPSETKVLELETV